MAPLSRGTNFDAAAAGAGKSLDISVTLCCLLVESAKNIDLVSTSAQESPFSISYSNLMLVVSPSHILLYCEEDDVPSKQSRTMHVPPDSHAAVPKRIDDKGILGNAGLLVSAPFVLPRQTETCHRGCHALGDSQRVHPVCPSSP